MLEVESDFSGNRSWDQRAYQWFIQTYRLNAFAIIDIIQWYQFLSRMPKK